MVGLCLYQFVMVCIGLRSTVAQSIKDTCKPGFYLESEIEGVEICTSCFDLCQLEPVLAFTKYHKCGIILGCINWVKNKCPRQEIYDPIVENCDACSVGCNNATLKTRGALCGIICNIIVGTPATVIVPFKSASNPSSTLGSSDESGEVHLRDILISVTVGLILGILFIVVLVYKIYKRRIYQNRLNQLQQCTESDPYDYPLNYRSSVSVATSYVHLPPESHFGDIELSEHTSAFATSLENSSEKSSLLPRGSNHTNGSIESSTMILVKPDPAATNFPGKPSKLVPLDTRIPSEHDYVKIIGARQFDLVKSQIGKTPRFTTSQERFPVTRVDPDEISQEIDLPTIYQPGTGEIGHPWISHGNRESNDYTSELPVQAPSIGQIMDQSATRSTPEMESVCQNANQDNQESSHNFLSYDSPFVSKNNGNNSENTSVASLYDFKETHEMSGNFGEPIDEVPPDERPHIKNETEHSQKTAQDIAGLPANLDMIPDVKTVLQKLAMLQWVKRLVSNGRFIRVWYDAIDEVNARRIIAEISGLSTRQFDCVHVRNAR